MADKKGDERKQAAAERFTSNPRGIVYRADGSVIVPEGSTREAEEARAAATALFLETGDSTALEELGVLQPLL